MESFASVFGEFVHEFITLFSEMAPFLLLGFLLAGILHVWVPNHLYVPKISKSNFMSVLWAALFSGDGRRFHTGDVLATRLAFRDTAPGGGFRDGALWRRVYEHRYAR